MFYFWLWEHLCKSDKTTRSLHYLQINVIHKDTGPKIIYKLTL